MKKLIFILFIFISGFLFAQQGTQKTATAPYFQKNVKIKDTLGIEGAIILNNDTINNFNYIPLIIGENGQLLYWNVDKWDTIPSAKLIYDGDSLSGNVKGSLSGLSVGDADSLGGVPASGYLVVADTTNLSDSLRLAWTTKLQLSDSAGNFITPYDTSLTHNWIENYFIKFSDSTGIFITPYDTILLSSRIDLLEALGLLNDTNYIHSTGNDIIWGTILFQDPISTKYMEIKGDVIGGDFGIVSNYTDNVVRATVGVVGSHTYLHDGKFSFYDNKVEFSELLECSDTVQLLFDRPILFSDSLLGTSVLLYNDGVNFVIDSDNPVILNNEFKLVNPSANYISSLTALDITTSSGNSIMSIDSTQTQFYENVFFEKTISTDSTIIITDASGADSSVFRVDATNFIIDNDNPIKITNLPVDASPDSMLTTTNGVIGKVAMVDLNDITVNVISADTLIMGNDTIIDIVVNLVDDGYYDLPAATTIKGELFVEGGTNRANFFITSGEVPYLDYYTDVVTTDTDNKFCLFGKRVRNRLGIAVIVHIIYRF